MHAHRGEKPTAADQTELYCMTASSEMHEWHECQQNQGYSSAGFGTGYSLLTLQGAVDWLIGDWIEVSE